MGHTERRTDRNEAKYVLHLEKTKQNKREQYKTINSREGEISLWGKVKIQKEHKITVLCFTVLNRIMLVMRRNEVNWGEMR